MLTGDENIVDIDFDAVWQVNPRASAGFRVQSPEPGRHHQGRGRERHARGHRPPQHPGRPDHRAGERRPGSAPDHAGDARCLWRRRPDQRGPDAGRAAARRCPAGLLRRERRPAGRRARPERGRRPSPAGSCPKPEARPPGPSSRPKAIASSRSPMRPVRRPVSGRSTRSTARPRRSAASASSSRPWSASTAGSTRSSSTRTARASCPSCRSTEMQRRSAPGRDADPAGSHAMNSSDSSHRPPDLLGCWSPSSSTARSSSCSRPSMRWCCASAPCSPRSRTIRA